ncbi:hypothetical protein [Streptomyces sp. MST-110588]|uniref:hypothetical protein n=1 Tax=Streptomyces sp. MST-110588 TaxID=2833628 RepID=UPI001F5D2F17|nr:hypothetical protein [Streptomyces sp. MST-110588]UNO41284.1 hypothetical protein KGS77_19050 [Streptomyces sp. MST-110588]
MAATALLLSGCGGGDDGGTGGGTGGRDGNRSTAAPSNGTATPVPGGGSGIDAKKLEGGWVTEGTHASDGLLILAIGRSRVLLTGKATCAGRLTTDTGPVTLDLTCKDGSTAYAKGTVKKLAGSTLEVTWASGRVSTFTKSPVPSGIPTDLPTALPTDFGGGR